MTNVDVASVASRFAKWISPAGSLMVQRKERSGEFEIENSGKASVRAATLVVRLEHEQFVLGRAFGVLCVRSSDETN